MQMFDTERKVSFPLTEMAPASARHWFAGQGRFPVDLFDRVVLLLSELVANSVIHSGLQDPEEVEISVRRIPGGLRVEVVDEGVGIDASMLPRPDHYGLLFAEKVSDRWGYTNHPTRVWFEIHGDER
jgi:anti-sigma regulatory factor (Ser/Thr protein kinase)